MFFWMHVCSIWSVQCGEPLVDHLSLTEDEGIGCTSKEDRDRSKTSDMYRVRKIEPSAWHQVSHQGTNERVRQGAEEASDYASDGRVPDEHDLSLLSQASQAGSVARECEKEMRRGRPQREGNAAQAGAEEICKVQKHDAQGYQNRPQEQLELSMLYSTEQAILNALELSIPEKRSYVLGCELDVGRDKRAVADVIVMGDAATSRSTMLDESTLAFLDAVELEPASPLQSPAWDLGCLEDPLSVLDDVVAAETAAAIDLERKHERSHQADNEAEQTKQRNDTYRSAQQPARRKTQKAELEALRSHVQELELELHQLQQRAAAPFACKLEPGATIEGNMSCVSLWERTAQRQKDERLRAEVENTKLRVVLEGQLKVAQSLEKLLRKRPLQEEASSVHRTLKRVPSCKSDRDITIFNDLEARLDSIYAQLDAVWLDTGLLVNQEELHEAEAKSDDADNIFLEVLDSRIIPFPVSKTVAAIWKLLSREVQVANGFIRTVAMTDDAIRMRFMLTFRLRRSEAHVQMSMIIKQFVQEDRVVLVWACEGHTEGGTFGSQRINTSETGWAVIEPHAPSSTDCVATTPNGSSSILQICIRMMPKFEDPSLQKTHSGLLTEMIIASYTANMSGLIQSVENLLIDELLT